VSRWCENHRAQPTITASTASGFGAVVEFSKEEVLEACGRVAIAQRSLIRSGDGDAARELAAVFALFEQRVVLTGRPTGRPPR
jgi:hypothetical protein